MITEDNLAAALKRLQQLAKDGEERFNSCSLESSDNESGALTFQMMAEVCHAFYEAVGEELYILYQP
jgi:hypothetical protein